MHDEERVLTKRQSYWLKHVRAWCIFWLILITHSGLSWSPILENVDHSFWFILITDSGSSWSPAGASTNNKQDIQTLTHYFLWRQELGNQRYLNC